MRTLSRPMFNMGGPIKQGIMHGIREPYKGGGKAALVGNPVYPRTGGREHHALVLGAAAPWAMRGLATLPKIWRGMKAAKTYTPWSKNLSKWGRLKDIMSPSGRFRKVPGKTDELSSAYIKGDFTKPMMATTTPGTRMGFWKAMRDPTRFGAAIRENPLTAFAAASAVPQTGLLAGKIAKAAPGTIWEGAKRYADLVIPGDQSSWYTPEEPPKGIEKPGGYPKATVTGKGSDKPLTKAQQEKWADAQRSKRLDNLLDIMGYDRSKKTAIADALIDASKIVSDRGTLDRKNITAELINPIIQATSKRLDKPEQIREAVGLMMAKGEIEKDLYKWKPGTHLKNAQDMADTLNIPLAEALNRVTGKANTLGEELAANQTAKRTPLVASEVEQLTRTWADKKKKKLQKTWTATEIKEAGLDKEEAVDIVSKAITGPDDDGLYVVGTEVIEVINGVPKRKW